MAHVAKGSAKAGSKGGVAQPAEDHSANYKKHERFPGVAGEVPEIFHKGEAGANQGGIDDTIGNIIEFIAQNKKEQEQAKPFHRFLRDTGVQPIERITQDITCSWTEEILQHI